MKGESILGGLAVQYGLAALVLAAISYGASLGAPLMFDDLPNLVENPLMRFDARFFDSWRAATVSGEAGLLLRPVSMFSFALNKGFSGDLNPVALKGTNLAIHLACTILIQRLALVIFQSLGERLRENAPSLSVLAAACWLLHPLHVSTVLYSVQRMAQLSAMFVLLGLLVYCHYRQRWLHHRPSTGDVVAAVLWGVLITCLAMLSKENGVLLPWLVLVLEVTVFGSRLGGEEHPHLQRLAWLLLLSPLALTIAVYFANPVVLTGPYGFRDFSLEERVLTQLRVLWHYVYWFFWPDIRNMGFQHDDIELSRSLVEPLTTLGAVAAWITITLVAVLLRRRFPVALLALLFFIVGHALESSVLPLEMAFEHRNYLPSVGLSLLLAVLIGSQWEKMPGIRPRVLVVPALGLLAVMLVARCHIWSDMTRFARANVVNHPNSVRAQYFYADALYSRIGRGDGTSVDAVTDGALLYSAREYFRRMNEVAGGHSTALVMLHFSDLVYLAEFGEREDWLGALSETMLSSEKLTASDQTALQSLADCALSGVCEGDRGRVTKLLEALLDRYPGNHQLLEQYYKLLASTAGGEDRAGSLAQLQARAPQVPVLYSYLVSEYLAAGDQPGVYLTLADWMAHDRIRKHLPLLRIVALGGANPGSPAALGGKEH